MGWQEKKAITRIFNTFKRVKVYDEDINALKLLNDFNEEECKKFISSNLIFAKLYCLVLRQNIEYYGDIKSAIKGINKELSLPINQSIEILTKVLNHKENVNYFKSIGVDFDTRKDETEIIKENQKEITNHLLKSWTFENVEKSFYKSANDTLKEINNYS